MCNKSVEYERICYRKTKLYIRSFASSVKTFTSEALSDTGQKLKLIGILLNKVIIQHLRAYLHYLAFVFSFTMINFVVNEFYCEIKNSNLM